MVQVSDAVVAAVLAGTLCQGCGQSALNHQCGTVIVSSAYRRANVVLASGGMTVPSVAECQDCGGPLHYKYSKNEVRFNCAWRQYETDRDGAGYPWTKGTKGIEVNATNTADFAAWYQANPKAGYGAMHQGDAKKQQAAAQAAVNAANGVATPAVSKPSTPAQMTAAGVAAPVQVAPTSAQVATAVAAPVAAAVAAPAGDAPLTKEQRRKLLRGMGK
jgi:hypothetical protein